MKRGITMDFTELTEFLDRITVDPGVPGVDCSVYKDHKEVYRHCAGYKDVKNGKKMQGDEIFNFYSPTKILTAAASMQLVEKGLITLETPAYDIIPEMKEMTYLKDVGDGKKEISKVTKPMTIRHLLSMTGGFDYDIHKKEIEDEKKRTDERCPTVETVKEIIKAPLLFEPGEHWNYSLCHDIMGAIIEIVSGKKLSEYYKENIFEPLGMTESGFYRDWSKADRFAHQYFYNDETKHADEMTIENDHVFGTEYESAGAGLISTVNDYMKFAETLTNMGTSPDGTRILSPDSVNEIRRNQLTEKQLPDVDWTQLKGYGYGFGVRTLLDPKKGETLSTVGEFGWSGAAGVYISMDPTKKITVVYAQHMRNNLEPYIHPRLRNHIYASFEK